MERHDYGARFPTRCCKFGSDAYSRLERLFDTVTIVLVGKYTILKDSYMSVTKALEHFGFQMHQNGFLRHPHLQQH